MTISNAGFGEKTTGQAVVQAYAKQVHGKTVLITGANPGGIGYSTAVALASASPKLLILAGRSSDKLAKTVEAVKAANAKIATKSLILDLSSQESCRKAAQDVLDDSEIDQIDILINNAGVMNISERTLSPEGIEMQFATNHIGHFLFTNLVMPKLVKAAENASSGATRIVNLSSRAVVYGPVRFADYNFTKKQTELPEDEHMSDQVRQLWGETEDKPYIPQAAYGQSKTANVLFSIALNKRLSGKRILSNAVHPGHIATDLGRHMDQEKLNAAVETFTKNIPNYHIKDLEDGCSSTLVAALDPKVDQKDIFFADCQFADWAPQYSTDPDKAEQLWTLSEDLVGEKFRY